jgi:hypothetical protein
MMRHLGGLRRALAALAILSVLLLPAVQLAHADMMDMPGMPCADGMAMPAAAGSPASDHPAPKHHGCCCDCCTCCVEAAVLPASGTMSIPSAAVAVSLAGFPVAPLFIPRSVDHLLPFSLPPPTSV